MKTMEPDVLSAVLPEFVKHKHRSFSTSTPFIANTQRKTHVKSLSGQFFDSGLGSSISESVTEESSSLIKNSSHNSSPKSPTCFLSPEPIEATITHSPIFSKNRNVGSDSLNISNISFSKSRHLIRRRLNLDLDIGEDVSLKHNDGQQDLVSLNITEDIQELSVIPGPIKQSTPSAETSVIEQRTLDLEKVIGACSPIELDRLIGRKMGREHVDILTELHIRNISFISTILSYMEPKDLCSMCMVSRTWQTICESNQKANQKRKKYIKYCRMKRREMKKENICMKPPRSPLRPLTSVSQALSTVQLLGTIPSKPDPDKSKTLAHQFMEVGKTLKNDETLRKCPRCRKPAKVPPVQERGKCQNGECGFDFCINCLGEYHGSKPCTPLQSKRTKTVSVGSKKSKTNLKRL